MTKWQRVLAPNPSPMTLTGTNTWLIGDGPVVVVDPGPSDASHLDAICAHDVALVLITHHHADHTEAIDALHDRTGAPVRAADARYCRAASPLIDGERVTASGEAIVVVATPGHTSDSLSLLLPGEAVLTGDTILGEGTTVIMHPDGAIAPYFASLDTLEALGDLTVLPGHGEPRESIAAVAREYRKHREARLQQVRETLETLGQNAGVEQLVDAIYGDVDARIRFAAEASLRAQLEYLRS